MDGAKCRSRGAEAAKGHSHVPTVVGCGLVGQNVDLDDLIDAQAVAELMGLAQRNTVSAYQRRYPAMPRPVIDLGHGRCKLWLRSEMERWRAARSERAMT